MPRFASMRARRGPEVFEPILVAKFDRARIGEHSLWKLTVALSHHEFRFALAYTLVSRLDST